MEDLDRLIAEIAGDRESGASVILESAIDVLQRVMPERPEHRLSVARALCAAQPGMAPIWNASLAAVRDDGQPERFEGFVRRVRRGPDVLARLVRELFADTDSSFPGTPAPLRIVTVSCSGSIRHALAAMAQTRYLHVSCAEGRPALEGRGMAAAMAQAGADVTVFSDAAIAEALQGADAVLVGADAVASEWFLNKVGTRMLAAAAGTAGIPVYVAASRDKFCAPALAPFITPRDGAAGEIWDAAPYGVSVRNPYFERVPLGLATAVITDAGIMPAANVPEYCTSLESAAPPALVKQLAGA